jgi:hypothetical protein
VAAELGSAGFVIRRHRRLAPLALVAVTIAATITVAAAITARDDYTIALPVSIPITATDDYFVSAASIMRPAQVMPDTGTAMDLIGEGNISDRTANAGWCKGECVRAVLHSRKLRR